MDNETTPKKSLKTTAGKIFLWLLALVFLLFALGLGEESLLAGGLALVASLLTMPLMRNLLKGRVPKVVGNGWVLSTVSIALMVGGFELGDRARAVDAAENAIASIEQLNDEIASAITSKSFENADDIVRKNRRIISASGLDVGSADVKSFLESLDAAELAIKNAVDEAEYAPTIESINKSITDGRGGEARQQYEAALERYQRSSEKAQGIKALEAKLVSLEVRVRKERECKTDFKQCANNEMLINNYSGMTGAKIACKNKANDLAKYGSPDWSWSPFGTYYKGDRYVKNGKVEIIDEDVQMMNGFGAMVNSRITCIYDLVEKNVITIDVR